MMLVLGRKENESIIIGDAIKVTIVGRSGSSIRVGVQAPREIRVMRAELDPQCFELVELGSQPVHDLE